MFNLRVEAARARTFYLERTAGSWRVVKVWEAGSVPQPGEMETMFQHGLHSNPDQRLFAEQLPTDLDPSSGHNGVVLLQKQREGHYRVLNQWLRPNQSVPADLNLYEPDRVLGEITMVIHRGGRMEAKDPRLRADAVRVAEAKLNQIVADNAPE